MEVVFNYIPKRGDVGYIKANVSWVDSRGKKHRNSFIKEFSRTINDTARALGTTIKSHVKKGYWGYLEDGKWKIDLESVPEYWKIKREKVLVDRLGKAYPVSVVADKSLEVMTGGFNPCQRELDGDKCYFMSRDISSESPRPGWESHRLKGFGKLPKDGEIYVAGYKAYALGDNQWQYWAPDGGLVKVNILSKSSIWQSYSFKSKKSSVNHISFKGARLSRR